MQEDSGAGSVFASSIIDLDTHDTTVDNLTMDTNAKVSSVLQVIGSFERRVCSHLSSLSADIDRLHVDVRCLHVAHELEQEAAAPKQEARFAVHVPRIVSLDAEGSKEDLLLVKRKNGSNVSLDVEGSKKDIEASDSMKKQATRQEAFPWWTKDVTKDLPNDGPNPKALASISKQISLTGASSKADMKRVRSHVGFGSEEREGLTPQQEDDDDDDVNDAPKKYFTRETFWSSNGEDISNRASSEEVDHAWSRRLGVFWSLCQGRFLLHPESSFRLVWDILSACALVFDAILVPYVLAWDPVHTGFVSGGTWATVVFWTFDVFVNFNTAVHSELGDLQTRRWQIFWHYLRRTLILDLAIVFCDWLGVILVFVDMSSSTEGISLFRLAKITRAVRIAGVMRFKKIKYRLENLQLRFPSEAWLMMTEIVGLFAFIFWLNHVLCCVWFLISTTAAGDAASSWLDLPDGMGQQTFRDAGPATQYTGALHWSISQLTPGNAQAVALNTYERAFSIVVLICGFLFSTTIISRLSALMVQFSMARKKQNEIVRVLRRYLRQRKVGSGLFRRVEKQIRLRTSDSRHLCMKDVPALTKLSKSLRGELKREIYAPYVLQQPFFLLWDAFDARVLCNLCETLDCPAFAQDDEIFAPGASVRTGYIVVGGTLSYTLQSALEDDSTCAETVQESAWIAPAALWASWQTRGTLQAASNCELMCLEGERVLKLLAQHRRLHHAMRAYQKHHIAFTQEVSGEHFQLSDLCDTVDQAMVFLSLPVSIKIQLAEPILEALRQRSWWRIGSAGALKSLEREVRAGTCTLLFAQDGSPVRVAVIVVLRVVRPKGQMLVQVASVRSWEAKPVCQLPGTKLRESEYPRQAVKRVVEELTSINVVGEDISVSNDVIDAATWEEESLTYSLMTRYTSHTFTARTGDAPGSDEGPPEMASDSLAVGRSMSNMDRTWTERYRISAQKMQATRVPLDDIGTGMPWLSQHYPDHTHIAVNAQGTGAVYAWMWPDDFSTLAESLHGKYRTRGTMPGS